MPHYHLAGGINLPKIIDCVGSDGKSRRQLVKVGALLSSFGSLVGERRKTFLFVLPLKLLLSLVINLIRAKRIINLHFSSFPFQFNS